MSSNFAPLYLIDKISRKWGILSLTRCDAINITANQ